MLAKALFFLVMCGVVVGAIWALDRLGCLPDDDFDDWRPS